MVATHSLYVVCKGVGGCPLIWVLCLCKSTTYSPVLGLLYILLHLAYLHYIHISYRDKVATDYLEDASSQDIAE